MDRFLSISTPLGIAWFDTQAGPVDVAPPGEPLPSQIEARAAECRERWQDDGRPKNSDSGERQGNIREFSTHITRQGRTVH